MWGWRLRRALRLAPALLALPLAGCLESPPDASEPACGVADDIAELRLGRDHACARLNNGGVWCWGLNDQGQLGDGTLVDRSQPSQVAGLDSVVQLAVGQDHSCALRGDGDLWCWGSGSNGQLGDGRTGDASEPVEVDLDGVADVALGDDFTCAVRQGGDVYCWGENEHGQGGPDFTEELATPTRIAVDGVAESLVAGWNHACARLEGGTVACWGGADVGQLGDDTLAERGAGEPVAGLEDVEALAAGGDHTCAVTGDGSLWCWGSNEKGQLAAAGDSPDDACEHAMGIALSCLPLKVEVGAEVIAAAAGLHHTCAVTREGAVRCAGGNEAGQLGNGSFDDSDAMVDVQIESTIASLAAGETQTCAVSQEDNVYCWGSNRAGQLAETAALVIAEPARVAETTGALDIAAGAAYTCIQFAIGTQCWGANDSGQLGDLSLQAQSSLTSVTAVSGDITQLAPGEEHTCVINAAARVRCWGRSSHGELGPAATEELEPMAVPVDLGGNIVQVDSGDEHSCAVRADGVPLCWGNDDRGQLGNGTGTGSGPDPVSLADALEVASGDEHSCARLAGGEVLCWGANDSGQLGDDSTTDQTAPGGAVLIDAEAIESGDDFVCALRGGAVLCWGDNEFGQLGDGSQENQLHPVTVQGLPAAGEMELGSDHACAIVAGADGLVAMCWGRNDGGQLGNGTTESSPRPVEVDLPGEPIRLAAGERHTCALVAAGTDEDQVYCWGSDLDGRVGSGRVLYHPTAIGPVAVCP